MMDAVLVQVGVDMLSRFLYEGHVTVVFTKKDGSERTMTCTKQLGLIPQEKHPKTTVVNENLVVTDLKESRKHDPEVVTVFDVEKQDWRSFHYTSLKSVTFPDRPNL